MVILSVSCNAFDYLVTTVWCHVMSAQMSDQMLAVCVPGKQHMHLLEVEEMVVEFSEAADRDVVGWM